MSILSRIFPFLLLVVFLVVTVRAESDPVEYPEDIASRLQQRYDTMRSLTFNFHQDIRGEMTGRPRQGSGQAIFLKNNGKARMRWDYLNPDRQVLLSDGITFSMYFAGLKQLIISPAEKLDSDLTYSFFSGKGVLQRDFYIRPADEEYKADDESGLKVIKIIPKSQQSQVQDIHLYVAADSLIRRIMIRDHFSTITVLNLSDIEVDKVTTGKSPEQVEAIFAFIPPEGTEIIHQ